MASVQRTVKVKFDGDSKGLERASKDGEREVDRFTRSVDKKFRKSGDDSGKSFGASLAKWFKGDGSKLIGEGGQIGGEAFSDGLKGALKTPVLGPVIAGSLLAAVTVAAPAAGAVAASGLVLAFGAGLAGLGVMFAAKSQTVKDAWSKTLKGMSADLTLLSKPFEQTLTQIAVFAQRTFDKFKPSLEAVFKEMAPAVTKFVDQVSKGLEQLQPAVRPLAEAFDAVLASLGPAIQGAVGNLSKGLTDLAESVKKNPDGLADLVDGIGGLTNKALGAISALNDFNGKIEDLTGGTSAVDLVFGKANSKIGMFLGWVKNGLNPLAGATNGLGYLAGSADKATTAVGLTGDATKYFTQGLNANQVASVLAGKAADSTSQRFRLQTQATDALFASMQKATNASLGLAGSQINYQAAIDAATASVKENGRNVDINTSKGRANKQALLDVASAANAQTQAMRDSNVPLATITKTAEGARANFVKLAEKMGYSSKEANKLADAVIGIPAKKTTTVAVNGTTAAKSNVDKLAQSIKLLPNYKTITIRYTQSGVNITTPSSVGRRASGGPTQPKRQYLLGERGPEIAEFTGSGAPRILSAEQTRAELTRAEQPLIVENHIEIGGEVVRVVRTEIKANNRELKRAVMAGAR